MILFLKGSHGVMNNIQDSLFKGSFLFTLIYSKTLIQAQYEMNKMKN